MVLAFRGTEKKLKDWKTDLRIKMEAVEGKKGRIHEGFQAAYEAVRNRIETKIKEHPGVPLFITGHSLGGALAIVATRFLHADNLAACYTFGKSACRRPRIIEGIQDPDLSGRQCERRSASRPSGKCDVVCRERH